MKMSCDKINESLAKAAQQSGEADCSGMEHSAWNLDN